MTQRCWQWRPYCTIWDSCQPIAGPSGFEVEGANAARDFARKQGMSEPRAQLIWDGVALNSTPSIGLYKEPEVALCTTGIGLDWGGWGYDTLLNRKSTRSSMPFLDFR